MDATPSRGEEPTYFLRSEHLGFRCWAEQDLPLAEKLWLDPRVTRLIGGPFSPENVAERLRREIDIMAMHRVQYWPIFFLRTGEFVGAAGLRPYGVEPRVYELGFHLRPEYWGIGLAEEAGRASIHYGFETIGAVGLVAGHHPENVRSRQVLRKLGFSPMGTDFYPPTGLEHPFYRLSRPRAVGVP